MQNQHGAGALAPLSWPELVHHDAAPSDRQPVMPGFIHEAGCAVDGPSFAFGDTFGVGSPAEQLERRLPRDVRRDPLSSAEQAADDLDAE